MVDAGQFGQSVDKLGVSILQTDFIIQLDTAGSHAFAFQGQFIDLTGNKGV